MTRIRDDEQGAVLMIVAISLLALLGMVVLTFDLGRGVALKRNMVNAADAAALAAARECGLANGPDDATTAADQLIVSNNSSAAMVGPPEFDSVAQCSGVGGAGERQVTVTVSVPQEYFFAQIFGFTSGTVTASATAEWTLGDTSPAPLRIDQLKIDECLEDGLVVGGRIDCYFTFEKGAAPLNADWGWLDLPEGWPIQDQDSNPMTCTAQAGGANDLNDYIGTMGGMGTPGKDFSAALWDPSGGGAPATYVCGSTGHKDTSVQAIQEWVDSVEEGMEDGTLQSEPVALFPVVACDTADSPGDSSCREWLYTPGVAYPVVKLQGFYVRHAWNGPDVNKDAEARANCNFNGPPARGFCVHLQTTGTDEPTTGGSVKVWLVD